LKTRDSRYALRVPNWSPTWAETQGLMPPEPIAIIASPIISQVGELPKYPIAASAAWPPQ
jgi:hypothetical protein